MPQQTPVEYERYCQSLFRLEGWKVLETPVSGDQGADLIAEFDRVRVVGQCKLYSDSVGNFAVQEVNAARSFYRADKAIVITNVGYTQSAVKLAASCAVELLLDSQVGAWAQRIRKADPRMLDMSTADMIATLTGLGMPVRTNGNGHYTISTKSGVISVASEGAFTTYADELLKKYANRRR